MTAEERFCGRCPAALPIGHKHRWCKECCRAYNQQYAKDHPRPRSPVIRPCKRCQQPTQIRGKQYYCGECSAIVKRELHRLQNRKDNERRAAAPQVCSRCKAEYPAGRKDYYCAPCALEYTREQYAKHPKRLRENARRWRLKHSEQARAAYHRWHETHNESAKASAAARQRQRKAKMTAGTARGKDYLAVLAAANGVCALCGQSPGRRLHVDHIIPLSRGGLHVRENLQALCQPCNQRKYNRLPGEL